MAKKIEINKFIMPIPHEPTDPKLIELSKKLTKEFTAMIAKLKGGN